MRRIAKGMKKLKLSFDILLSSPFVRAKRTAEIVAEVFGTKIKLTDALVPTANPKRLFQSAEALFRPGRKVVVVGHEPFLGQLVSLCLSGKSAVNIRLKKGGLCKLTSNSATLGAFTLEWMLTPGQLSEIC